MSRRQKWVLWPIAVLAALILVVVLVFDWNWLKGPVESAASSALDREVEIGGDLKVDLSLTPTITLEQVRVANAEWGSRPHMLTIPRVTFAIDLSRLLSGTIALPFLRVQEPDLLLETNQQGEGNWQFGPPDPEPSAPSVPTIEDLEIANAAIRYHEPARPQDVAATLETVEGSLTGEGVRLSADGTLDGEPLALSLESAPVDDLDAAGQRFPFELAARLGATELSAAGSADQLLQAQGLDVEVSLDSEDPETLLALVGRGQRELGKLDLDFSLTREEQTWHLRQLELQLGESDLSGEVSYDSGGEEPAITANLHSDQVRLAAVHDLIALATGGSEGAAEAPAVDAALADAQATLEDAAQEEGSLADYLNLSPAMLPAIDAEVSYTVDQLSGPELALHDLALNARLADRLPEVALSGSGQYQGEPVTIDVRLGDPAQQGDGEAYPIQADLAAAGTRVDLDGALTRPADFAGLELRFDVASQNLDQLLALAGVEVPPIPPFEIDGQLAQDGSRWQLSELDGALGESDIHGQMTVELREQQEPLITADLRSDLVRLQDVQALLPDQSEPAAEEVGVDAAIADAQAALAEDQEGAGGGLGLRPDMLPKVDAEVSYTVAELTGPELALSDLALQARLKDGLPRLELTGGGQYKETPVALDVQLGPAEPAAADAAYPVQARLEAAATEVQIEGVIGEPATLEGLDLEVQASSEDINGVLALAGFELPQIPPFAINGHVVQNGQVWRISDLYAQFSESDLSGQLSVDLSGPRPSITADLESNRLLMSDLVAASEKAAAVEERVDDTAGGEPEQEDDGLPFIEDGDIALDALPAIDADLELHANHVELPPVVFDRLEVALLLRDQVPVLDASGEGSFREQPLSVELHAGTKERLDNPEAPYPLELTLQSASTSLDLGGSVGTAAELHRPRRGRRARGRGSGLSRQDPAAAAAAHPALSARRQDHPPGREAALEPRRAAAAPSATATCRGRRQLRARRRAADPGRGSPLRDSSTSTIWACWSARRPAPTPDETASTAQQQRGGRGGAPIATCCPMRRSRAAAARDRRPRRVRRRHHPGRAAAARARDASTSRWRTAG